jgi:hypothetical protein
MKLGTKAVSYSLWEPTRYQAILKALNNELANIKKMYTNLYSL